VPRIAGVGVAVLLVVAGCTSTGNQAVPGRRVRAANGLSVVVPHGWTFDASDPTQLRVYEHGLWIGENCVAREREHVGVRLGVIRPGTPGAGAFPFGPRPARFTTRSGEGLSSGFADQPCGSSSQEIRFTDHGQLIDTYVDFGSRASKVDEARAYEILDSLRVSAES
jgi:hypothetical protein